ncbi:MFS transporter [Oceanithermus sp.]
MLKVLQNPDFGRLFASHFVSEIGNQIYRIALMAWAYQLTGSPALAAGVMVFSMLAQAIVAPLVAPLADVRERKRLLVFSEVTSGFAVMLLPLFFMNSIVGIYLVAFLVAGVQRLGEPAVMAIVPEMVEKDDLDAANSLIMLPQRSLEMVFLGLAGLLVATLGAKAAFWIDAASFFLAALVLLGMRDFPAKDEPSGSYWSMVVDGLSYIAKNPTARFVVGVLAPAAALGAVEGSVAVVLATDVLAKGDAKLGTIYYGFLDAAMAAGAVLGLFVVPYVTARYSRRAAFLVGLALFGIFEAAIGFTSWVGWAMLFFALAGIVNQIFIVPARTMLQESADPKFMARLFGGWGAAMSTATVIGFALGGFLAEWIGVSNAFIVAGVGVFLVAVAGAWFGRSVKA